MIAVSDFPTLNATLNDTSAVLLAYRLIKARRINAHRKIARQTFPIWLYISTTGVLIY